MRVRIRGVVYESEQDAADAFGVQRAHIVSMISRCREDFIGMGTGRHQRVSGKGKAICVGGVTYGSLREASAALGLRKNRLAEIVAKQKPGELEAVIKRLKERGTTRVSTAVTVQGITYESLRAAAAAFNVHVETIRRRLSNGTADTLEATPRENWRGRPRAVVLGGVSFASAKQATEALGFKHNYISYALGRFKNNPTVQAKVAAAVRAYAAKQGVPE
ncbi:Nuclease-associated modular DNA-binding 1 [uncultured Caudovirales phage]|uniref:Nuclease-associated modular DNA-binding 1 n=1 Tax=uncultured Caudovirales phage TaxID=2100421 RepID=A0A6J5KGX7_9CAUD|nr:Nuclease-associated modular DNA-binding 1 [uncultured Caudovirales phage]